MKKRSIVISAIIVTIIIGLCLFGISKDNKKMQNENLNNTIQITVSVFDKESNQIYNKNIETNKKYLSEVLEDNKDLNVKMEDGKYGKFITSILGIEQGDNYYWSYYINDEYANVGVSSCEVEQNKMYTFKIEKFE